MLRKILTTFAAVVCAAGIAAAANLPLVSGPQDPSQLLAVVNSLIRSINTGVSGRLNANVTATGTTTTIENTLMTYSLPAGQLTAIGDSLRVVCWGTTAANNNAKTAKLYFGNSVVSSASTGTTAPNAKKWVLELTVMRSGAAAQQVMGTGAIDLTQSTVYTNSGTDSLASAVVVKCTGTTASAVQDLTAQGMLVEQIK